MLWTSKHTKWLVDTGKRLRAIDGKEIEVWEFKHQKDEEILSAWAKHFRNHYCLDSEIDPLRGNQTRKDYLNNIKFPSSGTKLGPGVRAGDFGEILVSDYLQWLLGFWVPRIRWSSKAVRDESPKGSDVIGFRFYNGDKEISLDDTLIIFEVKTGFSRSNKNRLQDAINGSAKDHIRKDESLNFIKQKLRERMAIDEANMIQRFQNPVDSPYKEIYGAAAIISEEYFNENIIATTDINKTQISAKSKEFISHPNKENLLLLVIKGHAMMTLVNDLYRRAADES